MDAPADTPLDLEPFYILTTEGNIQGASAVLCPWAMEKVNGLLPEGFYILPSSIHECLIVSEKGGVSAKELKGMVRNANRMAVNNEEILSDNVYQYDRETGRLCQALKPKEKKRGTER